MKVCTDACLFGAWMAAKVMDWQKNLPGWIGHEKNMLDIGAGTGLLSLMMAQVFKGRIDAVEIDEAAAFQASDNFESSPWHANLQVLQGDIRVMHTGKKYELVLCNPPFYENDLKSPDQQRNLALHSNSLSLDELFASIERFMTADGKCTLLFPWNRKDILLEKAANAGFYPEEIVEVKQSDTHNYFRVMVFFGRKEVLPGMKEMIIRNGNDYSEEFKELLKPYYLQL